MSHSNQPEDEPFATADPTGSRAGAIARLVFLVVLTLLFLLSGVALVIQPASRLGGLMLLTLALITGAVTVMWVLILRGKPLQGGPRAARWFFGIGALVCAWLATVAALMIGNGDRSGYLLVMFIAAGGGFVYLIVTWWRFERTRRTNQRDG